MDEFTLTIIYRVVTLIVGFGVVYLGFVLFRVGVYEKAGDLKAAWGETNLALKQAAPGTFFALFGCVVMGISLWKGVTFENQRSAGPERENTGVEGNASPGLEDFADIFPDFVPLNVIQIIEKLEGKEEITDEERESLSKWKVRERTRIQAYEDFDRLRDTLPPELQKFLPPPMATG